MYPFVETLGSRVSRGDLSAALTLPYCNPILLLLLPLQRCLYGSSVAAVILGGEIATLHSTKFQHPAAFRGTSISLGDTISLQYEYRTPKYCQRASLSSTQPGLGAFGINFSPTSRQSATPLKHTLLHTQQRPREWMQNATLLYSVLCTLLPMTSLSLRLCNFGEMVGVASPIFRVEKEASMPDRSISAADADTDTDTDPAAATTTTFSFIHALEIRLLRS